MKKISYIILFAIIATFTGCKKELDSEGISRITYYPNFTMTGDATIFQTQGTSFTDPGVTATAGAQSLPVSVKVNGIYTGYKGTTVNTNVADKYVISYSATNVDGFAGTVTRTVYVAKTGDFVNSIEGLYTSTIVRNGVVSAQYQDLKYVIIWKTGTNTYELSDGIGGYYDLGRNYGPAYAAPGCTVIANNISANNFTLGPDFTVGSFGGVVQLTSFSIDAGTKTITFNSSWDAGFKFAVTLTQVNF
jgi:hypothetical protein